MASTPDSIDADPACEHVWEFSKPAHASVSISVCRLCHEIDGHELMRTLNEYAEKQLATLKQKPTTLLYAHSDGHTYSYVDQPGGTPDSGRERALLRGLLGYALAQLDQYEMAGGMIAVPCD